MAENGVANQVSRLGATRTSACTTTAARGLGDPLTERGHARSCGGPRRSRNAAQIRTPLLMLQAEEDRICPPADNEQLFTALKVLGREVEYVLYPEEHHEMKNYGRPDRRIDRMERILAWFDRMRSPRSASAQPVTSGSSRSARPPTVSASPRRDDPDRGRPGGTPRRRRRSQRRGRRATPPSAIPGADPLEGRRVGDPAGGVHPEPDAEGKDAPQVGPCLPSVREAGVQQRPADARQDGARDHHAGAQAPMLATEEGRHQEEEAQPDHEQRPPGPQLRAEPVLPGAGLLGGRRRRLRAGIVHPGAVLAGVGAALYTSLTEPMDSLDSCVERVH